MKLDLYKKLSDVCVLFVFIFFTCVAPTKHPEVTRMTPKILSSILKTHSKSPVGTKH